MPYPNGKEKFEMAVFLLQQEELLDAAVHICSRVIPRVTPVMLDTEIRQKENSPSQNSSIPCLCLTKYL